MSDDPTIKDALNGAVNAIKRGDLETGKAGLKWVLEREPNNVLAWLWMSRCAPTNEAKLECFNRVLAIDPNNKHALEGIQRFGGGDKSQASPASHLASSAAPSARTSGKQPRSVEMPEKPKRRRWLWIIGGGLFLMCMCSFVAVALAPDSDETTPVASVSDDSQAEQPPADSATVEPTDAPLPTNTPVPTRTPRPSATPDSLADYADKLILLVLAPYVEGLEQVSELSGEASASPLLMLNDEWRLDMAVALATISIANDALREFDVPDDMQDAHSALLDAASELDVMVELMAEGIDEIDANKIVLASEAMERANDHIDRANDFLR